MNDTIAILLTGKDCDACKSFKNIQEEVIDGKKIKSGGFLMTESSRFKGRPTKFIKYTVESFRELLTGNRESVYPSSRKLDYILEFTYGANSRQTVVEIVKHMIVNDSKTRTANIHSFRFIRGEDDIVEYKIEINGVYSAEESRKFKEGYLNLNNIPELYVDLMILKNSTSKTTFIDTLKSSHLPSTSLTDKIQHLLRNNSDDLYEKVSKEIVSATHSYISFRSLIEAWIPVQLSSYFNHAPMWLVTNETDYFESVYNEKHNLICYHNIGDMRPTNNSIGRTYPDNVVTRDDMRNYTKLGLKINHPNSVIEMYLEQNSRF